MNKSFNKFIYDRHSNIIFSLQNSRVKEFKFHNKMLTLRLDTLFRYIDNEEREYTGEVCFKDCDLSLCSMLIFNKTLGKGRFTGNSISLKEFMEVQLLIQDGFGRKGKILYPLLCIFGTVGI